MKSLTLYDTSVASDNLGDNIIMEAVTAELRRTLPAIYFYTVPTHDHLGRRARSIINSTEFGIAGGTNLLSSNFFRRQNWYVRPSDLTFLRNIVLLGVGWRGYQSEPNIVDRLVYRRILSDRFVHSVRDSYTQLRIESIGLRAVNTSCPTTWSLTPQHCQKIQLKKNSTAIAMLTFYHPDPELDKSTLDVVAERYDKIYFWPQQYEDLAYFRSLGSYDFEIVNPTLEAYTELLDTREVDYIGSRLHGGIRALQRFRRALILAVDNRATEMAKDTNLPVVDRQHLDSIRQWIESPQPVDIRLPQSAIDLWRSQFRS